MLNEDAQRDVKEFLFKHLEIRISQDKYAKFTVKLCFDGEVIDQDTFILENQ